MGGGGVIDYTWGLLQSAVISQSADWTLQSAVVSQSTDGNYGKDPELAQSGWQKNLRKQCLFSTGVVGGIKSYVIICVKLCMRFVRK